MRTGPLHDKDLIEEFWTYDLISRCDALEFPRNEVATKKCFNFSYKLHTYIYFVMVECGGRVKESHKLRKDATL